MCHQIVFWSWFVLETSPSQEQSNRLIWYYWEMPSLWTVSAFHLTNPHVARWFHCTCGLFSFKIWKATFLILRIIWHICVSHCTGCLTCQVMSRTKWKFQRSFEGCKWDLKVRIYSFVTHWDESAQFSLYA